MKNLIIGQSGGPTSVMNSSLYGAIMQCFEYSEIGTIYGMEFGIEGFLDGRIIEVVKSIFENGNLELLLTTPGAYLGTSKIPLPDDLDDPVYDQIFNKLEELEIGYFLYIGGNNSQDTIDKLARSGKLRGSEVVFVGIPKTIDNNMVSTDHVPGYGSSAKYIANTVREIATDASVYDISSITIVEMMGRMSGWLTAASALARKFKGDNPMLIYLPEVDFDLDKFIKDVKKCLQIRKQVVVCVSEGLHDKDGNLIRDYDSQEFDIRGEKNFSGCARYLKSVVAKHFHAKIRVVEMNVPQRCSISMISKTDQEEAVMAGQYAVKLAIRKMSGKVVTIVRVKDDPYLATCGMENAADISNQSRDFPVEWINEDENDVTDEFLAYITPLIQGYIVFPTDNEGIPTFVYRKR